ncbi:MAG: hypothetical protein ACYC9W_06190 [Candidatus Limnocylindria bacterium]
MLNLVDLYDSLHPARGRPQEEKADMLRGAVVLCAAALDELVLSLIVDAFPEAARRGLLGDAVTRWVRDDPRAFLNVLATERAEALRRIARENLGDQTFQRAAAIEGILRDTLGTAAPWRRAAHELAYTGGPSTEQDVKDSLDRFIERRNRIAHDGDRKTNAGGLRSISRVYVRDAAKLVLEIGLAANESIGDRLGS